MSTTVITVLLVQSSNKLPWCVVAYTGKQLTPEEFLCSVTNRNVDEVVSLDRAGRVGTAEQTPLRLIACSR